MTIAIIQGSPILRYDDSYYDFNLVEFEKYLRHSDNLIYLATVKEVDECKIKDLYKVDSKKVNFRIIPKDNILDYLFLRKSKREIIENATNEADLVVVKMPSITIGKYAAKYAKRINKPYFVEVCGCAWDSFWHHSIQGKVLAPFNYLVTRRIIFNSDHVVYVTNEFLQKRYPNSNHTIGCSNVLLPESDEDVLRRRIERIRNRKEGDILKIGTAGAVNVRYKSQDVVIKAISRLKQKGLIIEYYLAGGGTKDYLEDVARHYGVEDHVHFLGAVPKAQMYDFYDMLDIYIHPSIAEGLPRVLIEAESRALPAMGSNAAGTPELLTKDCVFRKNNIDEICNLLMSFTNDKMVEQAKINFERSKDYSFEVLNERRGLFYKEVLNKV